MNDYAVVIGASNIDIGGTPYNDLIKEDSNPGKINIGIGGVGRNIAHNLSKLGTDVKLITVAGGDPLGKELIDHCVKNGIDMSCSSIIDDRISSIYLYINDKNGDMKLALSDMDICEIITPSYLRKYDDLIKGASAVAADCNLSHDTLMYIKEISTAPVFTDTVSVSKASRIKDNIDGFFAVKPNVMEAELLTGMTIRTEADCVSAADKMLSMGAENVFISMSSDGILAADRDNMIIADKYPADIINTTGAGDSSTAAIVWAYMNHREGDFIEFAAKAANAAAALTIESVHSISPDLSAEKVMSIIKNSHSEIKKIR